MTDEQIITLLRSEHYSKAGQKLYAYFPVVKKLILRNSGNQQDAEDIFQESLIILIRKVREGNFVLKGNLTTYLYGVCRLLWSAHLRNKGKEIQRDKYPWFPEPEIDANPADRPIHLAVAALQQLGEKCRQLLLLFYLKKMPLREIAQRLQFSSEKTAKNQKYRCLEKAKLNLQTLISDNHE